MKRTVLVDAILDRILAPVREGWWEPTVSDWMRTLRTELRMTQAELAKRARIPQSHVAAIESGKIDPQIGTIKKIFAALSCDLVIRPRPKRPLKEILRSQAGKVALARLKQSTGNVALEGQAPNEDMFRQLLKRRTDQIVDDRREKLWREND